MRFPSGSSASARSPWRWARRSAGLPRPLAGFFDLGGQAIPVLSLHALLHGEDAAKAPDIYSHLLLTRNDGAATALLVDRVLDVVEADAAAVSPADREDSLNGCVAAHLQHDAALTPVLALDRLLLQAERTRLAALTQDAQSRLDAWSPA